MRNRLSFQKSSFMALALSCSALTAFGCLKSDPIGMVSSLDSGSSGDDTRQQSLS